MDKKRHFQKQLLESKIKENTNILSTLQITYNDLINSSNTCSNTCSSIINIDKLNILKQTKINIKQNITKLTSNVSQFEQELTLHPLQTKDKLVEEIIICNDEHERIASDKTESINTNLTNITNAILDKEQLLKDIELLKIEINLQSNTIFEFQKHYHSSRQNILESLKEKKQMKIKLNENIENANLTKNIFTEQINMLNTNIENLIEFKKLLVDNEYTNDSSNTTKLIKYYNLYNNTNTNTNNTNNDYNFNDSTVLLNDKLNKIEDIIINNQNQLLLLQKKLNKTIIQNNYSIKDNINNYNNNHNHNKVKVLNYNDNYKIEKEKKTQLELILDEKVYKYNNYQTLIIDNINNENISKIDNLNIDKINADKRLLTIKIRMNQDFESHKKLLRNKIETAKTEIKIQYENINKIHNEIQTITSTIEKDTILHNELYILENKMKKHTENIILISKDLEILNM